MGPMVQRMWKAAALGTVVFGATLMGEMVATADAPHAVEVPPHAEVMVIHATKCEHKSIDPAIGDAPPPSLGYDCLKLLDRKSLPLVVGAGSTMTLPNGRTFELRYNGRAEGKHKVTASVSNADRSPGFTKLADIAAEPNKPFHVGGFAHQGGVLFLSTKIVP